jgi:uncharacterized membrane protein YfcA
LDSDTLLRHTAFGFSALLIGISKAGFGGGMGILIGPLLTIFFDAKPAVGMMLPLLLCCDIIALYPYWRQWDWRNVRSLLPGGIIGIIVGAFALDAIDNKSLAHVIGGLAILFTVLQFGRSWLKREQPLEPRFSHAFAVGLATGFVSTLSHVGGLLTSMYLLMQRMDNRQFVATTTLFYFWLNLLKMPIYWQVGVMTQETIAQGLPYMPIVVLGTYLGVVLNRAVSDVWFGRIVRVSVLAIGIYLLVN